VKASMSIRFQDEPLLKTTENMKQLIKLKLAYLILIVQKFRTLREREPMKYKEEYRYALKQLKKIKVFCEKYRSRSPIMLRKYQSVTSLR
jgi:hypothetical protein